MNMEHYWTQPQKDSTLSIQERDVAPEETVSSRERHLLKRLRAGDEAAFMQLVEQYHASLLCLARKYVRSYSSAEEVVQETWMSVHQRLPFFEERSSLKTWIIRILINQACTCARRDQRLIPFSSLAEHADEPDGFAVELELFQAAEHSPSAAWISLTEDRRDIPEACLLSLETHARVVETLETLPATQRAVMVLCDIEGWRPEEICTRLGISTVNQRVLLHRARSKVRHALEKYFNDR